MLWGEEKSLVYCEYGVDGAACACFDWGVLVGVFEAEGEGGVVDKGRGRGDLEIDGWEMRDGGKGKSGDKKKIWARSIGIDFEREIVGFESNLAWLADYRLL